MRYQIIAFPAVFLVSLSASALQLPVTGQQSLEFHGYYRGGLGMSKHGSSQTNFQAPGARGKYRLGNEPNTSMELQLDYTYDMKEPVNNNATVQGTIMLSGYKDHGSSIDLTIGKLDQGYLSFNYLFASPMTKDMKVWLGRRYYERKSVHILNHFWLNPGQNSHTAIGFEDLNAGKGKLNVALFRNEDEFSVGVNDYLINSTVIDARWHGLRALQYSTLTVWAQLASRSKLPALNYETKSGSGLGFWLDSKYLKTSNTLAVFYQTGAAVTQSDFNPRPIREDQDNNPGQDWDLGEATVLEINNTLTRESLPNYSYQWAFVYRQEDRGITGDSKFSWYSTGIRPVYYFSKHLNIALEAGVDYVDDTINNRKGSLKKLTTAFQISAGRGFSNRPVLRLFVTLADWSDELKGTVGHVPGDAPYANDTHGWSLGAQTEVWW